MIRGCLPVLLLSSTAFAQAPFPAPMPKRYAIVVGSNSKVEDRPGLRFSHKDARAFAQVLLEVGQFSKEDVSLLLDPSPEKVLEALDHSIAQSRQSGSKAMLLFYYSGHADAVNLYPNGSALALSDLKTRLSSDAVDLKVGILDSCSGGGWTQAKGLRPAEPFPVGLQLDSEGTVLLASSSGREDAHEAEVLQGSFFTHHLVAGLRGAADKSVDGKVTLAEAFAYANAMTVRDTAQVAREPQHPSFDMRLRGRQDVVLTHLSEAHSSLTLIQKHGPLQVVSLATGQLVAELQPGESSTTLAVAAGDYVVRRVDEDEVWTSKVSVEPMSSTSFHEDRLLPSDTVAIAAKGLTAHTTLPPQFEIGAVTGLQSGEFNTLNPSVEGWLSWRLTRKIGWRAFRFQYNFVPRPTVADPGYVWAPTQQLFRLGTDLNFMFYRSEQSPRGFRFEGQLVPGFSLAYLMTPKTIAAAASNGIALGPSVEFAADIRLPYLPDIHLRSAAGVDMMFTGLSSLSASVRVSVGLTWRFGSTE